MDRLKISAYYFIQENTEEIEKASHELSIHSSVAGVAMLKTLVKRGYGCVFKSHDWQKTTA